MALAEPTRSYAAPNDEDALSGDWEAPFRGLIASAFANRDGSASREIGLQLELFHPPRSSERGATADRSSIRARLVMRNEVGNWVRSGISWSRLDYYSFAYSYEEGNGGRAEEQLRVLKELLWMSRIASRQAGYYSHNEQVVKLETINSRRLWDLLREACELGLPLMTSGKAALPVVVHPTPAVISVDVIRSDGDLALRPRAVIDGEQIPGPSCVLVGTPAHGVAWMSRSTTDSTGGTRICLAPFDSPVDDQLRELLDYERLHVPGYDEDRFLTEFFPVLRHRVALESSDGSVELPEPPPPTLVLSVGHLQGDRAELTWAWDIPGAGGTGLYEGAFDPYGRGQDQVAKFAIVESVTDTVESVPELFETTPFGERLLDNTVLEGFSYVRFSTDLLPTLSETPGVRVDQLGTAPHYRELLGAPTVSLGESGTSDNDWFDLTVTVDVEGEQVPFAELFIALAEGQSHLILPSGSFFSLDREELRQLGQLIAEARSLEDSSGDSVRLSRFQASFWEDLQRLGVVTAQAGRWEASVKALAGATPRTDHSVPKGLHGTLRPYQVAGFNWLAFLYELDLGGILADDMGLGKTLQALALICHTRESGLSQDPYLVVAPTSVVGNWASECNKFAPGLAVAAISETSARRGTPIKTVAARVDVVVTSYSLFRIDYDDYATVSWAGLFLDEAQFVKNRNSQAFQRAKMLPAPFKVAMTGTPFENNLMELWSLLSITAPGLFRSPERFAEYYRAPIEKKSDTERLDQLRRRVRPLMLRRTKDEVVKDLPDKQEQVLELELNPRHKKLYQTYLQRERQKVLGLLGDLQKHRFEIFRSLTLLRQASLDCSLVDAKHNKVPSTKLDALMELLGDIVEDGHRVLVFSQFTRFLDLARKRIESAGIDYCYLDGHTLKRDRVITKFRKGTAPVFLISLKAGGFGLNLTEADYCIILDPWWNPATEAQAVDRIHRIGQTKKVMVYRLVAKDTIEEKVMALKAKKEALFSNVMDGGAFESAALTVADIRELLS